MTKITPLPPHPKLLRNRAAAVIIYLISRVNDQLTKFLMTPFTRVLPNLYVGPQINRRGWLGLKQRHNITSVVNLRVESDDRERGIAPEHYLWLPTIDHTSPTVEQLHRAAEFIKDRVDAGEGVYIHCAAGVGRAPLTAAAYLVLEGYKVDDAIELIRTRRPFISQSPNQRARLIQYAEYIKDQYRKI